MNADCDDQAGLQELAGAATLLFYQTEEGQEGRNAYVEKRPPDFGKFVRHPWLKSRSEKLWKICVKHCWSE